MSRYILELKPNKAVLGYAPEGAATKMVEVTNPDQKLEVAFGFDHALGLFFDIYSTNEEDDEVMEHTSGSTLFDKISRFHLMEVIDYYASAEEKESLKGVIGKIMMDLPF